MTFNHQKIRKSALSLIGVLLLIYVGYQFHMATKKGLQTETVTYASVSDSIQVQAIALREEQLVAEDYSGLVSYVVGDGSNVAKGSPLANTYPDESGAAAQTKLGALDRQIALMEQLLSPGESYISNSGMIGSQIYTALGNLGIQISEGDFSNLADSRNAFHLALSRKNMIAGLEQETDYSARLDALKAQRAEIAAAAESQNGAINSPEAGYFSNSFDGYESLYAPADALSLSAEQLRELMDKEPAAVPQNAIGKVVTGFNWYFAADFSAEQMVRLGGVQTVKIKVPYASSEPIPADIVAKNRDTSTGETAVIFKCTYMNPEIAKIRKENIQITLATYEGLLVNEKSILFEDYEQQVYDSDTGETTTVKHENVKGVYIKDGAKIKFVQIFSDKTLNGYAICKTELSEQEQEMLVTGRTISLYDEVIVGGTDLYDGKLIA